MSRAVEPARVLVDWCMLALADLRLKLLPWRLNRRLVTPERDSGLPTPGPAARVVVDRECRAVVAAARFPLAFNMTCLRRSIVLRSRLRRLGIPTRLVLGARRGPDGRITAHAWLRAGDLRIDSYGGEPGCVVFETSAGAAHRGES